MKLKDTNGWSRIFFYICDIDGCTRRFEFIEELLEFRDPSTAIIAALFIESWNQEPIEDQKKGCHVDVGVHMTRLNPTALQCLRLEHSSRTRLNCA